MLQRSFIAALCLCTAATCQAAGPDVEQAAAAPLAPGAYDPAPHRAERMQLYVGESRLLQVPGLTRVAVGNGHVLRAVSPQPDQILLSGRADGETTVVLWHRGAPTQRIQVSVMAAETAIVARDIAQYLKHIPRAHASIIGNKVVLDGHGLSDRDLQKLRVLTSQYKGSVVDFADPNGWDKMVSVDVKMLDMPRNEVHDLGIQWSGVGGGTIAGIWSPVRAGSRSTEFAVNAPPNAPVIAANALSNSMPLPGGVNVLSLLDMGLNAQLRMLESSGNATLLAEPQLSTRSGSTASFLVGGKVPYTSSSAFGSTVKFQDYGIKLQVVPRVSAGDEIDTAIKVEDSQIDASITTASGPALTQRSMSAEFNVHAGQTIVLSGLFTRNLSNSTQRVPVLGSLPLLGGLFRYHGINDQQDELVVFVTPTIVNAHSLMTTRLVRSANAYMRLNLPGPGPVLPVPGGNGILVDGELHHAETRNHRRAGTDVQR